VDAERVLGGWLELSVLLADCDDERLMLDCIVERGTRMVDGSVLDQGEPFSVSIPRLGTDDMRIRMIYDVVRTAHARDQDVQLTRVDHDTLLLCAPTESVLIEIDSPR